MSAPVIRIAPFAGLVPRFGEQLLPDSAATEASNLLLTSGEIRPMRPISLAHSPAGAPPWLAVYRAEWGGVEKWGAWGKDVDIAAAPLSVDVEQRYYWTGDGEPRFATFTNFPGSPYAIGIPRPTAKPTASHSGGTGTAVSRIYCYTFFSALGEESGPSPSSDLATGRVDGTWAVAGMEAFPASSGTGSVSHAAGVSTFTNTGNHWLRVGDEVVIGTQTVAVSQVVSPSVFRVLGNFTGSTSWARKAPWNTVGMKRRLYRSAGTVATFQLVNDDVGVSFNDTLTDLQILGDELISQTWDPPPPGLKGMLALPSGAMVGFIGNQLRFSEPFQPHAWPPEYSAGTDYEIIGIAAYGSTVVAATAGNPYVFDGVDPASVTPLKVNNVWPCLAKRSLVSVGDGVLFATSYGLAYVGSAGPNIWSAALYTVEEWEPLNPASMYSATAEGRVVVAYTPENSETSILLFNPGEQALLTKLAIPSTELYTDPRNGKLYIVDQSAINLFNSAEGEFLPFTWKSKEFNLPAPVNYGAAKVDFTSAANAVDRANAQANYTADTGFNLAIINTGTLDHDYGGYAFGDVDMAGDNLIEPRQSGLDTLTFTLFIDGVEKFTRTVLDDTAFSLPSGYKSDRLAVQVSGTVRVRAIKLGETKNALRQA